MSSIIAIQTDFGRGGGSAMRGVCKLISPSLDIYEIDHTISKFNVKEASRSLRNNIPYWPSGTVFVSVVDPGVGTSRRASVALLKNGSYVVSPDNGSLTLLLKEPGILAIRQIDETVNRLKGTEKVSIFHGRDLFAYCGAKLAAGIIGFEGVGPEYPVEEIVRYDEGEYTCEEGKVSGLVTDMMRTFGNLDSNIPIEAAEKAGLRVGDKVRVTVREKDRVVYDGAVPYEVSFGHVGLGETLVYNSSDGVLGVGINKGDFIRTYQIGFGNDWTITIEKEENHG